MPHESRLFVKAGLVYLALTFVLGGLLLIGEGLGWAVPRALAVEHAHLGGVGWLVNLVIGIALWMLPLNRERFPATQGRYPSGTVYACFVLLNGGLVVRLLAEPWYQFAANPVAAVLLVLAGIAQPLAIVLFVLIAWQRIRAPSHPAPGVR